MRKTKLTLHVFVLFLLSVCSTARAQQFDIDPIYYYIFDSDSLKGFDENAARASAISEHFLGSEFKIKMYRLKREYINNKYGLNNTPSGYQNSYFTAPMAAKPGAVPGCVNEDFEASTAGVITTSNQVSGWTVVEGYNGYVSSGSAASLTAAFPNGLSGATSCNLIGCCPLPPSHSEIIDCSVPGGYIDNIIGSQYPIFSVFGTGTVSGAAATNTQITQGLFGTKVLRLNDENTGDYSMAKLAKTFAVSSSNALFQFAFISVFAPGHGCCDAGGFQIKLYDNGTSSSGTPTTITCPTFSVSAPSGACTATVPMQYYIVGGWTPHTNSNYNNIYNPWKISSMDLSSYIGKFITIEVIVSDCNAGGHFGCVYFDAQCGPMTVYGNGNPYDAGANVTVPTCGAAGATICAADGLGPFSWAGPGITPNQSTPSMTNQCITTSISAQFTLYMQPQGACTPIQRIVNASVTPAPLLLVSALQATCGQTLAIVSVTPSGSAANPSSLSWNPTPLSLNSSTTVGSYQIPSGFTPSVITVTGSDPLGCIVIATVNVNPAPPYPTFTITNVTNSSSITCYHPTVELAAVSNYNYNNGSLNYFWASASSTFATNSVTIVNPGTYTVDAIDPVTLCGVTHSITIGINTVAPVSTLNPNLQNITCSLTSITNVTATASPSVNITHMFMAPQGGTFTSQSFSVPYTPFGVGTYSYCLRNDINGCTSCKEFTVTSNQGFPTFSVVSAQDFTLGCNSKSVAVINITGGNTSLPPGGAVSYTILAPGSSTTTPAGILSNINTYSVTVPGSYTIITKDNTSFCETRLPLSILSNTFLPDISAVVDRQILDCYTPKVTLKGQSLTNDVDYFWSFAGTPNTQLGDTITVYTTAIATNSFVGNYTLNVTDISSTCRSTSIVPIYQNLFVPKAVITNGGTNAISCKTPTVNLTNQSSTTIPPGTGYPTNAPVIASEWHGPTPQEPRYKTTTYLAATVGPYTMVALDLNNGCTSSATISILDNRIYPDLSTAITQTVLDCGAALTTLTATTLNGPASDMNYTWSAPPTASIANQYSLVLSTNEPGEYAVLVKNKQNGCVRSANFTVVNGSLTANFEPDKTEGYAPLTVNFKNLSASSSSVNGTASITSVWSFGNSTTKTFKALSSTASDGSAVYTQPGTYTVTLYASKGTCLESVQKIIKVEIPSTLVIPNVFTPNGDGANDLFFVKSTNLAEITAVIYDRWGHMVYELTSDKGNIEWDGNNQYGKEVAEGTYFYIIKATGKDGIEYDQKGTINLYR